MGIGDFMDGINFNIRTVKIDESVQAVFPDIVREYYPAITYTGSNIDEFQHLNTRQRNRKECENPFSILFRVLLCKQQGIRAF